MIIHFLHKTGWLTNESVKMLLRKNRLEINGVQLI